MSTHHIYFSYEESLSAFKADKTAEEITIASKYMMSKLMGMLNAIVDTDGLITSNDFTVFHLDQNYIEDHYENADKQHAWFFIKDTTSPKIKLYLKMKFGFED